MKQNMQNQWLQKGHDVRRCGILGCGRMGATLAYTLMQTGWFSDLVLVDPDYRVAESEATDLAHALSYRTPMDIYAGDYADLSDCGLIILSPSFRLDTGASDGSPAASCTSPFRTIVQNVALYNQNAILLCVIDPVDPLTYLTWRTSGFPASRVIGLGTLPETARLKHLVGRHLGVDSRNVHTFIVGEHGKNCFPVWSLANVSGVDMRHFCDGCGREYDKTVLDSLFCDVNESAYRMLRNAGGGYFAAAEAVKRLVSAIVHDEHSILPVSVLMEGYYGLGEVFMSLPCVINRNGIRRVLEIPLSEEEEAALRRSATHLLGMKDRLLPI